jgi:nicotinamidase-related amidase
MANMYDFQTVPTEVPPPFDEETATIVVDFQGTFFPSPENSGDKQELPVPGAEDILPNVQTGILMANAAQIMTIATVDSHRKGKNPTILSSFQGLSGRTWVDAQEMSKWTERDNPIRPDAGFTYEQYRTWNEMICATPIGGTMIWEDHSLIGTKLHAIHPLLHALLVKNPNFIKFLKGSQSSLLPGLRGFCPESYSAARLSTGESLGLGELLLARGIKKVRLYGLAGDFCDGSTGVDLAGYGLDVWMCVDGQASICVPKLVGDLSSDQFMVGNLISAGTHFFTTANDLAVNGHLLKAS